MSSNEKICNKCKALKPFSDFYKRAASNDGLSHKCKNCQNAYGVEYALKNREKILARNRKYYDQNKEERQKYGKNYYEQNKDVRSAKAKEYYEKHKEKILHRRSENKEFFNKKSNDYYHNNKEKCAKLNKEWKKLNRAKLTAKQNERYTSQRKRTPVWLTDKDREQMTRFYEQAAELSAATGIKHHVDHIIPLHGETVSGLHVPQNLQVLNYIENIRKKNKYNEWGNDA